MLWWGSWVSKGPAELRLDDNALDNLAISSQEVLAKFQHRVAYAPVIDDDVVAWSTAALSLLSRPQSCSLSSSVILREYVLSNADSKCEWIVGTDDKAERVERMARLLVSSPWVVVDVNMAHKHLATLYPTGDKGAQSAEVSMHVMSFLKISQTNENKL